MIKKILLLCLTFVFCLLVSCSSSQGGEQDKYTIKLAFENVPGEPGYIAAEKWAELAAEKSGGRLEVLLYPSSQLGNKKDLIEQMMLGADIVTIGDGSALADYAPDLGIMAAPYLVDDFAKLDKIVESDWFKKVTTEDLGAKGLVVVANNWDYGIMQLLTKQPVKTPSDLRGMKIRTPNSAFYIMATEAMGATPTPMILADAYTSLSQGVVDGLFSPVPVLHLGKYYEQAKYLDLTDQIYLRSLWVGSKAFMEKLPADVYQAFLDAGREAGLLVNQLNNDLYDESLQAMIDNGVIVIDDVDKAAFAKRVEESGLYKTAHPDWPADLYDTIQKIINE